MTVWKGVILETQPAEARHLLGTRAPSQAAIWLLFGLAVRFPSLMTLESANLQTSSTQGPSTKWNLHGSKLILRAPWEKVRTCPV